MRVRNLMRFLKDYKADEAKDTPVPKSGMIGVVLHNPVRENDLDRFDRLLAHVDLGEVELEIHYMARAIFVGADLENGRDMRQVS